MKKMLLLVLLSAVIMTGCSVGVPRRQYEEVVRERDQYQEMYEDLYDKVEDILGEDWDWDADRDDDGWNIDDWDDDDWNGGHKRDPDPANDYTELMEVEELTWTLHDESYLALIIHNTASEPVDLYAEVEFNNTDKRIVGTDVASAYVIEPGQEAVLVFSNDESFSGYQYKLTAAGNSYYKPVVSNLDIEINETDSKYILSATNTGIETAEFVTYTILFYQGDHIVDYDWGYFTGSDGIEPGETAHDEIPKSSLDYDSYRVFYEGRLDD